MWFMRLKSLGALEGRLFMGSDLGLVGCSRNGLQLTFIRLPPFRCPSPTATSTYTHAYRPYDNFEIISWRGKVSRTTLFWCATRCRCKRTVPTINTCNRNVLVWIHLTFHSLRSLSLKDWWPLFSKVTLRYAWYTEYLDKTPGCS